jgi:hypothetical protein
MIAGLPIEYGCARVAARLSQRPDDRLWHRLQSARSVPAMLEAIRATGTAAAVSGVPLAGDADAIELAFRQQLRTRVDEVASWAPEDWRGSVLAIRQLVDLPAIVALAGDETPPRWIADDPVLAPWAGGSRAARRAVLLQSAWGPLVAALDAPSSTTSKPRPRKQSLAAGTAPLHRAVDAWIEAWTATWPPLPEAAGQALLQLVQSLRRNLQQFAALAADRAGAARHDLAAWLAARVRRLGVQPATLFAYLALSALDLERLRGEFVLRARLGDQR